MRKKAILDSNETDYSAEERERGVTPTYEWETGEGKKSATFTRHCFMGCESLVRISSVPISSISVSLSVHVGLQESAGSCV